MFMWIWVSKALYLYGGHIHQFPLRIIRPYSMEDLSSGIDIDTRAGLPEKKAERRRIVFIEALGSAFVGCCHNGSVWYHWKVTQAARGWSQNSEQQVNKHLGQEEDICQLWWTEQTLWCQGLSSNLLCSRRRRPAQGPTGYREKR